VCAPDSELTGLSGPDLTHRTTSVQITSGTSGTVPRAMVCASARNVIYSIICTLLVSPTHSWIQPSAALVCFSVYPLIPILLCWLCARDLSHIGTILMYFIRLGFNFCSQYPLASAVKTSFLMFSMYLSLKVDYHLNQRPFDLKN
jgi:hypothetical protein